MPSITEIRLTIGKTINMGNYNSVRIEAGLTATINEGDFARASLAEMADTLSDHLQTILARAYHSSLGEEPRFPSAPAKGLRT